MARAHEVLGGRWTLLIVREILCGSHRFNDIRRGIPRVSRTVLSERLQALIFVGAIARTNGPQGPEYELTEAGQDLAMLVSAFGTWGQRWLARKPAKEDLDLEPLLVDMQRRVRFTVLPKEPFVVRFEVRGHHQRFMLLRKTEASLCHRNPGFPERARPSRRSELSCPGYKNWVLPQTSRRLSVILSWPPSPRYEGHAVAARKPATATPS